MKIRKYSLAVLILAAFLVGCQQNTETKQEKIEGMGEEDNVDLSLYDSPYTYGEKREDGTYDFYIYAAPVQYEQEGQYQKIDNKLIESEQEGYGYENAGNRIKTFFPADESGDFRMEKEDKYFCLEISQIIGKGKKETFKNLYGQEKEAACYALKSGGLLYAYPVYAGIHFEYVFPDGIQADEDLSMKIEMQKLKASVISNEYMQFHQNDMIVFLYQPFLKLGSEGELEQLHIWELVKEKKDDSIQIEASDLPKGEKSEMHLEFSLLWDVEAMPDSTVYEKKDDNVFSARSAMAGQSEGTGTGLHYLRYRFIYFYFINPEDMLEAEYCVKNLNGRQDTGQPELHEPLEQWSSTQLCWEERPEYGAICQNQKVRLSEDGWYCFDITNFAKGAVADATGMTESIGSVITCENGHVFLATSDNGEFIPYIRMHLKNLPEGFTEHESINEVDN